MKTSHVAEIYRKYYASLQFERAGLFEAVRQHYHSRDVLYPGSFVHITPSFYFPHVVYVDQSPAAATFFAEKESVQDLINRNKDYPQPAYFRFISSDFQQSLELEENSFDLLISLYAGNVTQTCQKYMRKNGLMLTNNHHNDAITAMQEGHCQLVGAVTHHGGKYSVTEQNLEALLERTTKTVRKSDDLQQTDQGLAYKENTVYFVFSRIQ